MFYRFRQALHYARFRHATRDIARTAPIPCDRSAACAIHTMLSAADAPLYLVGIKSLLRFYSGVAVVIHSDGSLGPDDIAMLRQHIPGCTIVSVTEADARADQHLGKDTFMRQCRDWDASWRRVIDTELWTNTPKKIIMDSDILFLRRPDEVVDWIEQSGGHFLMGQPPVEPPAPPPVSGKAHIQLVYRHHVPVIGERLGLARTFPDGTTSGFYGCSGDVLAPARVEKLVKACLELGISMRDWGSEQCSVIYLLASAGATRLSPDLYVNFAPDQAGCEERAHLIHFLGYCRFYKGIYVRSARAIIQDLRRPVPAPA
jgi:hypothetical protein